MLTTVHPLTPRATGPLPWSHVEERLERSRNYWIATTRADGRPHAMPVWGVWVTGTLYFGTGRSSVKGKNLVRDPRIAVHLESGDDVVILEGTVREVTDSDTFAAIDAAYQTKYGMGVGEAGGDNEAVWYRVLPRIAHAWFENDFLNSATRWQFPTE